MLNQLWWWLNAEAGPNRRVWMDLIPVFAIGASAVVAIIVMVSNWDFSRQQARQAYGESIMPTIVMLSNSVQSTMGKNVGKGPAINIKMSIELRSFGFPPRESTGRFGY